MLFPCLSCANILWVKCTVCSSTGALSPLSLFWFNLIHSKGLFWLKFPLHALPTLSSAVLRVPPALSREGAGVSALLNYLVFVQCEALHSFQLYCCSWLEGFLLFSNLNPSPVPWTGVVTQPSVCQPMGTSVLPGAAQELCSLCLDMRTLGLGQTLSCSGKGLMDEISFTRPWLCSGHPARVCCAVM